MKKPLALLVLTLALCACAAAQVSRKEGDRQAAVAVANKLFEAMRAKNAEAIRALFMPEGQLVAIDRPRTGSGPSTTRVFTPESFARLIAESKAPEFDEKMSRFNVQIFGDMALVYGPYTFHMGDKFSHCGTNSFQLVRTPTAGR